MKQSLIPFVLVIAFVFLIACKSSTNIVASWKNPEVWATHTSEDRRILIALLTRDMKIKTKLEYALAKEAAKRNMIAIKSTTVFPAHFHQTNPSEMELMSLITPHNVDAILTVSLINKQSASRYVYGSSYAPYPTFKWYGKFYSYYNNWYRIAYEPGYYSTERTRFLESNLYDATNGSLLWSAQSDTINSNSIDKVMADYPKKLMQRMRKDRLLKE